jgi:hypothetical protein
MKTIDFSRSFSTFRIDTLKRPPLTVSHKPPFSLNNARIQLDCVCRISEKSGSWSQRFVLGAPCKTERVGVERDIWTNPNAEYVPVYSEDRFLILKSWALVGTRVMLYPPSLGWQPERQTGMIANTYDSLRVDISYCEGEELPDGSAIVAAALANRPLVARTVIENERYSAAIEYPVKTINANERDTVYQTDTGPILLPDLTREPDELISAMELAFIAVNSPDWAEVLVRVPTEIAAGASTYHYSSPRRLDAHNTMIALS